MIIKIKSSEIKQVASSIECYLFKEIREGESHNYEWLEKLCSFHKNLNSINSDNDFIEIDIDENIASTLSHLIENYLYAEAAEYIENDMDWLTEMISINTQIKGNNTSDTSGNNEEGNMQEIKNKEKSEPDQSNKKNSKSKKSKQKLENEEIEESQENTNESTNDENFEFNADFLNEGLDLDEDFDLDEMY